MPDLSERCADLPELAVAPGEVLLEQGTRPGRLYVLVEGEFQIERDGQPFARIDSPGAVFGEMSAIMEKPTTATVRATAPSRVRVSDDPLGFLATRPDVTLEVLRMTATRLDSMTRYLADVKRQYAEMSGHLGMVDQVLAALLHHQAPPLRSGSAREPEPEY